MFPAELREFTRITESGRICEQPLDLVRAGEGGG
jgi:hypothetical protein